MLDLYKAFGSVHHVIVLNILFMMDLRGNVCDYSESYLRKRMQFVDMGYCFGSRLEMTSGEPQGSVLEPTLDLDSDRHIIGPW